MLNGYVFEKNVYDYVIKESKSSAEYILRKIESFIRPHRRKILIVDDSDLAKTTIKSFLKEINIDTVECNDGKEAIEYIQENKNDIILVITDYQMPNMDGLELCLRIRSLFNKDELAILATSTTDDRKTIHKFLQVGANDFIIKPLDKDEILLKVRTQLELLDLFKQTKELANKDFLTGAYNRRYFFEAIDSIITKNLRKDQPLAVAVLDVDKFKSINDTYGHNIGDIAIKEVKNILSSHLRSSDLIARFGGEEFVIIVEELSLENVKNLFEKIRELFEKNELQYDDKVIKYTVSIGIYYNLIKDIGQALIKADEALYEAKKSGRNRVIIYSE